MGDISGQEIVLPTAIVILGGLVTSTLLTLFVVPSCICALAGPNSHQASPARQLDGNAIDGVPKGGDFWHRRLPAVAPSRTWWNW